MIWTKTYNFRKKVYGIHSDEGEFRDEQILVDFKYCEEKRDYQTIENRIINGLQWGWLTEITSSSIILASMNLASTNSSSKETNEDKVLIIVPTTSLVKQMYGDFCEYADNDDDWFATENCHEIMAGLDKGHETKRVYISTWQSIYKFPKKYFSQFGCVIGDEAHLFKAKSLTNVLTKLDVCKYRFGLTGTLDGMQTHRLVLEGLFDSLNRVVSTKELIDKKTLAEFDIKALVLTYSEEECKLVKKMNYQDEMDFIVTHQKRNEFIRDLTLNLNTNTLVLFQYVEKHGSVLYDMINTSAKDRRVFYVFGGTDTQTREQIREITEKEKNAIIVASYGTFSTGINIRNLHNIVFSSPSKSRVHTLQSIGRGLRKSESKDTATLYDIADDFTHKSKRNFTINIQKAVR